MFYYKYNIDMVQVAYITSISGNTTLSTDFDTYIIEVSGNITLTLPTITCDGMVYNLIRTDVTKSIVTIQGTGGNLINGVSTTTMSYKGCMELYTIDGEWVTNGTVSAVSPGGKFDFNYSTATTPYITFSPGVGVNLAINDFYYPGSNNGGGIPSLFVFVFSVSATSLYTLELLHLSGGSGVTAGSIIATMTTTTTPTPPSILSTSTVTLANISTTACIWEIRVTRLSGNQGIRVYNCFIGL